MTDKTSTQAERSWPVGILGTSYQSVCKGCEMSFYAGRRFMSHCRVCADKPTKCECVYETARNSKAVRAGAVMSGGIKTRCAKCTEELAVKKTFWNQTPEEALRHNHPTGGYAHSACLGCENPFSGEKRQCYCLACSEAMTAPVPTVDAPFVSPEPPPTPYERELLTILIEECMEVAQRATKMLRFGVREIQPGQRYNNAERLSEEMGDLRAIADRCHEEDLMNPFTIETARIAKHRKLKKFMQTSKETEE